MSEETPGTTTDDRGPNPGAAPDPDALTDDELYRSERAQLIKRRDELADLFDKGRFALAGGAIALSATVTKDLPPTSDARHWLLWAWVALSVSLVASVVCVFLAALSHERQRRILDDDRRAGNGEMRLLKTGRRNPFNAWLAWLNPASIVLLAIGLALMGLAFGQALPFRPEPSTRP